MDDNNAYAMTDTNLYCYGCELDTEIRSLCKCASFVTAIIVLIV